MKRNNLLYFCFVLVFLWPVKVGCEDREWGDYYSLEINGFFHFFFRENQKKHQPNQKMNFNI